MKESWSTHSAAELISTNPHDVFTSITIMGYSMEYSQLKDPMPSLVDLDIRVLKDDLIVAQANFSDAETVGAYCQNVEVDKEHQRKKLATAMYLLAELIYSKPLFNFWSGDHCQSEAAKAMWANPKRPFGQRPLWFV